MKPPAHRWPLRAGLVTLAVKGGVLVDGPMSLSPKSRDLLKRYGFALVPAALALFLRAVLPLPEGTAIY